MKNGKSFFKKIKYFLCVKVPKKVYKYFLCGIGVIIIGLLVFDLFMSNKSISCTFDGEMVQGAEFTKGIYTYHYMEDGNNKRWKRISDDGWGVKINDLEVTEITESPCTTINEKPVVSASYMFANAKKLSKINISNFNTSKITDMSYMFYMVGKEASEVSILNLGKFDTSNVINMEGMFAHSGFKSKKYVLDGVNKFDTDNVTNMSKMFNYTAYKSTEIKIGDLSKFDMDNVTDISNMFENFAYYASSLDIGDLNSWKISKEVNQENAFMITGYKSKYKVPSWYTGETKEKNKIEEE